MKRQLCWKCQNTNAVKCEWFEDDTKYPDYVKVEDGVICECEHFCKIAKCHSLYWAENADKDALVGLIAQVFGKHKRTIYRNYDFFLAKYKNLLTNKNKQV